MSVLEIVTAVGLMVLFLGVMAVSLRRVEGPEASGRCGSRSRGRR